MGRKTVLVDFDGVLNQYNGEFDKDKLPEINSGAENFLKSLAEKYIVKIFTTRNKTQVSKWISHYNLNKYVKSVTNVKEPAWLLIDDRCIHFDGNYTKTLEKIEKFKVWYK